jgi:cholest-4-en-3-one 26-monooxygenase
MPESSSPRIGPEILDPGRYARDGYPHEAFKRLRDETPVHWIGDATTPFWAITRHADIVEISRQPELFSSLPHFQIVVGAEYGSPDEREPETIIQMDPPKHRRYRELISRRFTPRALRSIEAALDPIADEVISALEAEGREGECDFVERIAAPFPMAVISWLLDAPREDWRLLYEWSNAVVVPNDPEYQQAGETPHETRLRASKSLYDYFGRLAEERRKGDADDLVSLLARAQVEGEPLDPHVLVSYYLLLIVGGNETTRNALSGGMGALIERPACWEELATDPSKIRNAAEEALRWSTPVVQMARTATRDTELRGQKIRAGETTALFYASANRDERVFPDPFEFRLDRHPNPHLSFGIGEHFCVGAHLARIEIRCMLRRLLERFERFEAAAAPTRLRASSVGGFKTLPVRYRFK